MPLPKIAHPTFELIQPSTGEKLFFRPFLVKEEKLLLIAKESNDSTDIHRAIKQMINNCVLNENFDVNQIPIFDMQYIFINIRSKSVSNIIEFKVEDSTDGLEYALELNLDEVIVQFTDDHNNKIEIDENNGIVMKYPLTAIGEKISKLKNMTDVTYQTVVECIDYIYDENEVYSWKDSTDAEKQEYLDYLDTDTMKKINKFFETIPKIEHTIKYKNSKDEEKIVVFRDLNDFFTLG